MGAVASGLIGDPVALDPERICEHGGLEGLEGGVAIHVAGLHQYTCGGGNARTSLGAGEFAAFVPFVAAVEEFDRSVGFAVTGEDPAVLLDLFQFLAVEAHIHAPGAVGAHAFLFIDALDEEHVFVLKAPVAVLGASAAGLINLGEDRADLIVCAVMRGGDAHLARFGIVKQDAAPAVLSDDAGVFENRFLRIRRGHTQRRVL